MTLFDEPPAPAAPSEPLVRVRMLVAYDGTPFHGFAANPGVKTVGGSLVRALTPILRHDVELTCAGRTDTGVHAWGQVVTFDTTEGMDLAAVQRAVNKLCAPSVVVRAIEVASAEFDARYSAVARTYRYTILNRAVPDPFLAAWSWHVEQPLDRAALELACDPLIGEHDFSAFCRRPKLADGAEASMVRRVTDACWKDAGQGVLQFEVTANAFCHQMVRSVVGTLVEVGLGKRRAGDLSGTIRSRDRSRAGQLAPPHGLCLWHVSYPDQPFAQAGPPP